MKASEKKSRLVQDLKARVKELEENQDNLKDEICDLEETRDRLRSVIKGIENIAFGVSNPMEVLRGR